MTTRRRLQEGALLRRGLNVRSVITLPVAAVGFGPSRQRQSCSCSPQQLGRDPFALRWSAGFRHDRFWPIAD